VLPMKESRLVQLRTVPPLPAASAPPFVTRGHSTDAHFRVDATIDRPGADETGTGIPTSLTACEETCVQHVVARTGSPIRLCAHAACLPAHVNL